MLTKIGWIGLGNMGIPMAENLIKAGYPVTVYNRTPEKESALKELGATVANSPKELIESAEIIFLMVSDDNAIKHLFLTENGLLSANTSGKIVVNMSTVSPEISKEMSVLCQEQDNQYLDAPVSGSVKQAQDGQLVIMAGGHPETFEMVKPLFEKIGKLALHLGETGAGNTAKLAINTMLAIQAQGFAEAIVFAQNNGIATEDLLTLINNSALSNIFMKLKGELILNDKYDAVFTIKNMAKDLRLAKGIGLDSPLGNAAYDTFHKAEEQFGKEDVIAVIKELKR